MAKVVYIQGFKPAKLVNTYVNKKGVTMVKVIWDNLYRGDYGSGNVFHEGVYPMSRCKIVRARGAWKRWWKKFQF